MLLTFVPPGEERRQLFQTDDDMLAWEFARLMPEPLSDRETALRSCPSLEVRDPAGAESVYLDWAAFLQALL